MANSDSDDRIKTKDNPSDFDEGLGDDWESAFQAEDFMFSPDEEEGDDFFQKVSSSTTYKFTPPGQSELAHLPDLDQKSPPVGQNSTMGHPPGTSSAVRRRVRRKGFPGLPPVHPFILGGAALLIALVALVLLWPTGRQSEPEVSRRPAPSTLGTAKPEASGSPEGIRRKWQLASFILPVSATESTEKPTFLEVDLSLILVLPPGDELPRDKRFFVRDLIYRYYKDQPLSTLRRYALAREEMKRALLVWLRQHWPEAAIETVVFVRYQLI
jgi:hypothetical protein